MTVTHIPPQFFGFFALGFVAAIGMFAMLVVLARRLDLSFAKPGAADEIGKLIWAGENTLARLGVTKAVWAIRGLFLVTAVSVGAAAVTLYMAAE